MAANAIFYTTAKRHNSTLVPTTGTTIQVDLKGGSDLLDPVFLLNASSVPGYSMMLYAGRYYFITGIKSVRNDLYEVSGHVDVLATYKAHIKNMTPYVAYYTHSNTEISDKRLATKTTRTVLKKSQQFDILGTGSSSDYAVILNVVGKESCECYAVSQSDARTILNNLDNWFDNTGDYDPNGGTKDGSGIKPSSDSMFSWASVEDAIKSFFDETVFFWKQWFSSGKVADNLRSASVFPINMSRVPGFPDNVKLGQYDSDVTGKRIDDRIISDGVTIDIPWQASDWRRNAPYHELFIYIPYIGLIQLSPSDLIGDSTLNVAVSADITTGDAVFSIYTDTNRYIGQYATNLSADFAIGYSNITTAKAVNTLTGVSIAGAAALASGGATAVAGAFTGGFLSLANNIGGNPTCIGSNMGGATLGLTHSVVMYSVFHDTTVAPSSVSAEKGTPYNGVLALSGVTGYVQTIGASCAGSMTDTERQEINRLMDGGIFIE